MENSSNNPNEDVDEADAAAYSEADIRLDTAIVGDEHETEMSLRLFMSFWSLFPHLRTAWGRDSPVNMYEILIVKHIREH